MGKTMQVAGNGRRFVVCGAGIAGLTTAYWLRRNGFEVVVVDSAPAPRPGGQAVDVRGPALDVVDRMGMGDQLRTARTSMHGMSVVDADGEEVFRSTDVTLTGGPVDGADVEILRDDLVAVLQSAIDESTTGNDSVEVRYGVTVDEVCEGADGVVVTLSDGARITAAALIGADGLHSRVRSLLFSTEDVQHRDLGSHLSVFTMPNTFRLESWQVFCSTADTMAGVYTARDDAEVRVNLGYRGGDPYDHRDLDGQRARVAEAFAGQGWWIPQLVEAMYSAPDFYLAPMTQILMDTWSSGSTVLVGDAAWCTTPMSGQGTSLALVGSYVLAGELARFGAGDANAVRMGLESYEQLMRSFVTANQQLALDNEERSRKMMYGAEEEDSAVGQEAADGIEEHWVATAATAIDLPDYLSH